MINYLHIHEWEADRHHAEMLRACAKRQRLSLDGGVRTRQHGLLYRLTHRRPAAPKPGMPRAS